MKTLIENFNSAQKVTMVVFAIVTLAMAYAYATGQLTDFSFTATGVAR